MPALQGGPAHHRQAMADEKNVRLVFQNFPLQSHDWAAKAAYYGDCIGRASPDAFWKYVASVYDAQKDITASNADEKLTALAEQAGAKGADTASCAAKPETATRVAAIHRIGRGARSHRHAYAVRERKKDQQCERIALRGIERSNGVRCSRGKLAEVMGMGVWVSREAASEYSPRRKPWVKGEVQQAERGERRTPVLPLHATSASRPRRFPSARGLRPAA